MQEAVTALLLENQQQAAALEEGAAATNELHRQNGFLRDTVSGHETSIAELTLALEVTKQQQGAQFPT